MSAYKIENPHGRQGRVWTAEYETRDAAADAIRSAYGWDAVVLSTSFSDADRDGKDRSAWCAYETQEDCDSDGDGSRAPWIIQVSK